MERLLTLHLPPLIIYRPNSCISHFYLTEKVALAVQILKNQNAFKKREEKLGEGPQPHLGDSRGQLISTPAPSFQEHLTQVPKFQLPPELRVSGGTDASQPFLTQDQGVPNCILPSHNSHSHSHPPQNSQNVNQEKLTEINISQEQRKRGGGREGGRVLPQEAARVRGWGADKDPSPLLGKGGTPCSSRTWGVVGFPPQRFKETWTSGAARGGGWVSPSCACGQGSGCPHAGLCGNPARCSAGPVARAEAKGGGAPQASS